MSPKFASNLAAVVPDFLACVHSKQNSGTCTVTDNDDGCGGRKA